MSSRSPVRDCRDQRLSRSVWTWTLAATSFALAIAITWFVVEPPVPLVHWWNPERRPELRQLLATSPALRVTEGRITGGFAWGPAPSLTRGRLRPSELTPRTRLALLEIEDGATRQMSARGLAARGTARLLSSDVEAAVATLEESVAVNGRYAFAWADLSAAYLARARVPARAADLPRALDAAERAIALEPGQLEATFNRALVLERLHLRSQSRSAWERYLTLDAASGWSNEAREHVRRLEERGDGSTVDLSSLREQLFDRILPAWAVAYGQSDPDAQRRSLEAADEIVKQLSVAPADSYATRVRASIRRAMAEQSSRGLSALAIGLRSYGRAREAYGKNDFGASDSAFALAERTLKSAGNVLWLQAAFHRAVIAYRRRDLAAASARLTALRSETAAQPFPGVTGRIDWTLGLIALFEGRFSFSADRYENAISLLESAREPSNAAFVRGLLASAYDQRGDSVRSWQVRVAALQGSVREGTPLRAAQEAVRARWGFAALRFAEAAEERASALRHPLNVADALRVQAVAWQSLGNDSAARAKLQAARRMLAPIASAEGVDRVLAEIDVAEASVSAGDDGPEGPAAADRALRYFRSSNPPALERLPELYLLQARAQRTRRDVGAAKASLLAGTETLMRFKSEVLEGTERAALSDVVRQIVDELVELEAGTPAAGGSFEVVERARAWDLPDGAVPPVGRAQLSAMLDEGTVVVDFVVADDRSFAWVVTSKGSRFLEIHARRGELADLVRRVSAPSFDAGAGRQLRTLLLNPIAELAAARRVIIVPDGPLHQLPFGMLPGRQTQYLIEELVIAYAPSAASLSSRPASEPSVRVLAIGNPLLDRDAYGELSELKWAEKEARDIAGAYPDSTLQTRDRATRKAFLENIESADVLHFAGHALADRLIAGDSALLFSGGPDDRVTADDIRRLSLTRTRLVVLSACDTAVGAMTQSQGPMSVGRAFLAAGAQTVVASLWPVDDAASYELLKEFHQRYRRGSPPGYALREAQMSLLRSQDSRLGAPASWGAFTVTRVGLDRPNPSTKSEVSR